MSHAGTDRKARPPRRERGSAIIAVLGVVALLTLILVSTLHCIGMERVTSCSHSAGEQARLSAESGCSAAMTQLMLACSNRPGYLVGLSNSETAGETAPCVILGATNLSSERQILPLFSCDLKSLLPFPELPADLLGSLLEERLSTNTAVSVDLNAPPSPGASGGNQKMMIEPGGRYPALWQSLRDSTGATVGRYAYVLTDESARLNPRLHHGHPRSDPVDWDGGPGDIPLTNGTTFLPDSGEATRLETIAAVMPDTGSLRAAFDDPDNTVAKESLLTLEECSCPDLIPPGMPEAGKPKYNLNDLATNPAWGATPYDRALRIASVIDLNLPKFKQRDPSLRTKGADATLYLKRLACSIVDYISPQTGPTGPPGGEPEGCDLVPYVTQIAERCTRTALTSNSVTVESRVFAEIWNPTTSTIPAGGIPRLRLLNRSLLEFGTGIVTPFEDYDGTAPPMPALRPNEFAVIDFGSASQTWTSPEATSKPPQWRNGPAGNADTIHHQPFEFFWNGRLAGLTRHPPLSPGDAWGGVSHLGLTLKDNLPHWQCMTIPTWSGNGSNGSSSDEADRAVQQGDYRFVGDPRATFLTAYTWSAAAKYPSMSLWKGISPAALMNRGYLMDPGIAWTARDRVPVDPFTGIAPSGDGQSPDQIASPYSASGSGSEAPAVIRKGPMLSLGELGHVFDPVQADDAGQAPPGGTPASRFCCGGGRSLRIGQPEFHFGDPSSDWDLPGKRAIELIDLFTLADPGRQPDSDTNFTKEGSPGRINVNTASHPVLTALFTGIRVTSDRRFTNSEITPTAADRLATLVEQNRPYTKLSDLHILTASLANAETFSPPLSRNVPGSFPPVADVFDRAREEAFGKLIGHCTVTSRTFHLYVIGEALDKRGGTTATSVMDAVVRISPDVTGELLPSLHGIRWH